MREFMNAYGWGILGTIVTAIFGWIGAKIKKHLDEKDNAEFTEKTVARVVKAVEQMYSGLKGSEKYEKALTNISQILEKKGIFLTELELQVMIESAVAEFNKPWAVIE